MTADENPYQSPMPGESPSRRAPRKWLSFPVALELFVLLAIITTLISLLLPLLG